MKSARTRSFLVDEEREVIEVSAETLRCATIERHEQIPPATAGTDKCHVADAFPSIPATIQYLFYAALK